MRRADLYAVDNSSTLFEFAATGRPVVVLNAPWYRRSVTAWPRFWWGADVGANVAYPAALTETILGALKDTNKQADRRARIAAEVFPHVGDASRLAAEAIERFLK